MNVSHPADSSGRRFFIEAIYPCVDAGLFPVKRTAGEAIDVWADIFRDGHAVIAAALLWRREGETSWQPGPMRYVDNDRWVGSFTPPQPGRYSYAIEAWTDAFATWRRDFLLKRDAGLEVTLEAREGRALLEDVTAYRAARDIIAEARQGFDEANDPQTLLAEGLLAAMAQHRPRARDRRPRL